MVDLDKLMGYIEGSNIDLEVALEDIDCPDTPVEGLAGMLEANGMKRCTGCGCWFYYHDDDIALCDDCRGL